MREKSSKDVMVEGFFPHHQGTLSVAVQVVQSVASSKQPVSVACISETERLTLPCLFQPSQDVLISMCISFGKLILQ